MNTLRDQLEKQCTLSWESSVSNPYALRTHWTNQRISIGIDSNWQVEWMAIQSRLSGLSLVDTIERRQVTISTSSSSLVDDDARLACTIAQNILGIDLLVASRSVDWESSVTNGRGHWNGSRRIVIHPIVSLPVIEWAIEHLLQLEFCWIFLVNTRLFIIIILMKLTRLLLTSRTGLRKPHTL